MPWPSMHLMPHDLSGIPVKPGIAVFLGDLERPIGRFGGGVAPDFLLAVDDPARAGMEFLDQAKIDGIAVGRTGSGPAQDVIGYLLGG